MERGASHLERSASHLKVQRTMLSVMFVIVRSEFCHCQRLMVTITITQTSCQSACAGVLAKESEPTLGAINEKAAVRKRRGHRTLPLTPFVKTENWKIFGISLRWKVTKKALADT